MRDDVETTVRPYGGGWMVYFTTPHYKRSTYVSTVWGAGWWLRRERRRYDKIMKL